MPSLLQTQCLRADGSHYGHPGCACPTVELVGHGVRKKAELKGYGAFGTPATPPDVYRNYTLSGSFHMQARPAVPHAPYPVVMTFDFGGGGAAPGVFDPATGVLSNFDQPDATITLNNAGFDEASGTQSYGNFFGAAFLDTSGAQSAASYTDGGSAGDPGFGSVDWSPWNQWNMVFHFISATQIKVSMEAHDETNGAGTEFKTDGGDVFLTLSNKDTEADALTRATAEEFDLDGDPDTFLSIWELRADDSLDYGHLAMKFAAICRNLIAGLHYKVTIPIQRRTAKGYGLYAAGEGSEDARYTALYGGTWTNVSSFVANFTAASREHIVGGTWADAGAMDGLITADEVTPTTDMVDMTNSANRGYQFRFGTPVVEWVPS